MNSNLIKFAIIATLLLTSANLIAQENKPVSDSIKISSDLRLYENAVLNRPAVYPGGQAAIDKYFADHFEYTSQMDGVKGRTIVSFVVEKDGSVTNIKILRGLGSGTEVETIRVLNKMPKWKPAVHKGEYKRVVITIPIKIG